MPKVTVERMARIKVEIDENHDLHALIENGSLSFVTISGPDKTEDLVFGSNGLQTLLAALREMRTKIRQLGVEIDG